MAEILTSDKKSLTLFEESVLIDKKLLKWRNAEKSIDKTTLNKNNNINSNTGTSLPFEEGNSWFIGDSSNPDNSTLEQQINSLNRDVDGNVNSSMGWLPLYEIAEGVNFDTIASAGIKELTKYIAENKLKFVIGGYGSLGRTRSNNNIFLNTQNGYALPPKSEIEKKEKSFSFKNIFNYFKKKKIEEDDLDLMDATVFFNLVKLTSKESISTYRDRVSSYLKEVYNAASIGQIALLENLIRGMVTNKYEAVLYAENLYYAVSEDQMVSFIKKCEKGIKLDYIKNFTRPIPQDVIDKVNQVNKLEVFDNYVVLYYDPDGKIYQETEKERAKRKDPILFGLIAGSKKLYYIADWIDEHCDLTLEQFVDIIGIKKEELHLDYKPSKENKEEQKEEDKVEKNTQKPKKKKKRKPMSNKTTDLAMD